MQNPHGTAASARDGQGSASKAVRPFSLLQTCRMHSAHTAQRIRLAGSVRRALRIARAVISILEITELPSGIGEGRRYLTVFKAGGFLPQNACAAAWPARASNRRMHCAHGAWPRSVKMIPPVRILHTADIKPSVRAVSRTKNAYGEAERLLSEELPVRTTHVRQISDAGAAIMSLDLVSPIRILRTGSARRMSGTPNR